MLRWKVTIPEENAPKAADTARVGSPRHRHSPMTRATPAAPRMAISGVSLVRSMASPERAASLSARDQVIARGYGPKTGIQAWPERVWPPHVPPPATGKILVIHPSGARKTSQVTKGMTGFRAAVRGRRHSGRETRARAGPLLLVSRDDSRVSAKEKTPCAKPCSLR